MSNDQSNNSSPQEQNYASRLRQLQQQQKASQATQAGKEMLKQQAKKRIWLWVAGILAGIFLNPITWIIIGCLFIIIVVVAVITQVPGFEFLLKLI